MTVDIAALEKIALTVRMLSADGVEKANSGHPGLPLGAADYASVLWANYLRFNPKNPAWPNRDRFVLSAGHGSMLLYSLLHLFGYDLPLAELKNFRQWESKTPGHPEFEHTPGVETTTGPLGQGIGNAVGMALSAKMLAARYSASLFNYRVFGIVSDGDLMEGVSAEAASLAGHLGLNNLICLYDDNHISIGGDTSVCFTESVEGRFKAYNWNVLRCDGHNLQEITCALDKATAEGTRPTLIIARTSIGFGSPNKAGSADVHGSPLGAEELRLTKQNLGWPLEPHFHVPQEVGEACCAALSDNIKRAVQWEEDFSKWKAANPALAAELTSQLQRTLPESLKSDLLAAFKDGKKDATRNLSGQAIQVIAKLVPAFVGGSADLEPSTKTLIKGAKDVQKEDFSGKNLRFGVREHGMGAIANGMAYCRCWIPYTSTFLVFSDYMRPAIRIAALSHLQQLFIFTHDSFWVGEDGPTHQPIEHIAGLRLIPNLYVFRPADGIEVAMCYHTALELKSSPSAILCSRQNLPPLSRDAAFSPDEISKGAYIVSGPEHSGVVLLATGSEVWVAVEAAKLLANEGVRARVVSMPCMELFLALPQAARDAIIPPAARKISIEAGCTALWERIVGSDGLTIGVDHYGASAPGELLADKFGFTPEAVRARISKWL